MPEQPKYGVSRRDFLRMAGLGMGLAVVSFAPDGILSGTATRTVHARTLSKRAGTLRVGWTSPTTTDPAKFADAPDISIGVAIYNYLFTLDTQSRLVPSLAKSSSVSDDGLVYTLTLQTGVKFHDGSDFGAKDVKFTFERLKSKDVGSGAAALFGSVTSIDVVDAATVNFTLSEPVAPFLTYLADYHTCILKDGTKDPVKELNGTGPFKTTADKIDFARGASFVANDAYWGNAKLDSLEMVFVKATPDLIPALQGGQIDWMARLPIERYTDLKGDSNLSTTSLATNGFSNVRLRSDRKPGSDVKVRQAFRMAMDRDKINQAVYQGLAIPGRDSPIGPLYGLYYTEKTPLPKPDATAAKKLLADAGYPDGLTIDFYVPDSEQNSNELAQVLQAQWKEAGITANLKIVPSDTYYSDAPNNWLDADLAVTSWASRPDPQAYLDVAYHSQQGKDLGKWNEAHFSDAELDKAIDAARITADPKKRAEYFATVQQILIERGPSYIPYFRPLLAAFSKKVTGVELLADPGLTSFANAEIAS